MVRARQGYAIRAGGWGRGPARDVTAQHVLSRAGALGARVTRGSAGEFSGKCDFYLLTKFSPPIFVRVISCRPNADLSSNLHFVKICSSALSLRDWRWEGKLGDSPFFIGSRGCHTRPLWSLIGPLKRGRIFSTGRPGLFWVGSVLSNTLGYPVSRHLSFEL